MAFMGEPAAGRKMTKARYEAAFCRAAIALPDDIEGQGRTQREFPAMAFKGRGSLRRRNKNKSDRTFRLNISPERDILLFSILGNSGDPAGVSRGGVKVGRLRQQSLAHGAEG